MADATQSHFAPSRANILTVSGNYLTVLNNGGFDGGAKFAISTNCTKAGPWETFLFIPLDPLQRTFALQTFSGYYVTAVNGGGLAGPGGIDTDRNSPAAWELIVIEKQGLGSFSLSTTDGYYLTAVNGGGIVGNGTINTNRDQVGPWEMFTFEPVQS